MEVYKTPESELIGDSVREFKPIKGLLIGLLISVVLVNIVSMIEGVAFVIISDVDILDPEAESQLIKNWYFLTTDLIICTIVVFFAGRSVGKRTPGQEIKYGLILATISVLIYIPLFISADSFTLYPAWYNSLIFIFLIGSILYGAKSTMKT